MQKMSYLASPRWKLLRGFFTALATLMAVQAHALDLPDGSLHPDLIAPGLFDWTLPDDAIRLEGDSGSVDMSMVIDPEGPHMQPQHNVYYFIPSADGILEINTPYVSVIYVGHVDYLHGRYKRVLYQWNFRGSPRILYSVKMGDVLALDCVPFFDCSLSYTLHPDVDADGLIDTWEEDMVNADTQDGVTTIQAISALGDFDNDGISNFTEQFSQTDPADATDTPKIFTATSEFWNYYYKYQYAREVTEEELATWPALWAWNGNGAKSNNTYFSGLSDVVTHAKNLEWLSLYDVPSPSLEQIASLEKLRYLYYAPGSRELLEMVADMPGIEMLQVDGGGLKSLEPLANHPGISYLRIADTFITRFDNRTPYYNLIYDISPLVTIPNLTYLDLSGNSIRDITPLLEIEKLKIVILIGNYLDLREGSSASAVIDQLEERGVNVVLEDSRYIMTNDADQSSPWWDDFRSSNAHPGYVETSSDPRYSHSRDEVGIGWIQKDLFPWVYAFGLPNGGAWLWVYDDQIGNRAEFYAFSYSQQSWIWVSSLWGYYYQFSGESSGWHAFK